MSLLHQHPDYNLAMQNRPDFLNVTPDFKDLEISPIGLGLAALGRPGYINLGHAEDIADGRYDAMQSHALHMLDVAYEMGIRYFDTAASYGAGEKFLGSWVFDRGFHIVGVTVASKWGYQYTADWQSDAEIHEIKNHSLENLNSSFVWSCLRLGRAMKIYQIHSATFESGVLDDVEVLKKLARIREEGRLVGLTVSGARQAELIDKAIEVEVDGEKLFAVVQATWNLLETSAADALANAKAAGMAIIVKEALANGRLTERNTEAGFQSKLKLLKEQAEQLKCTLDALAIAAAVNQPWSDVVLSGATTIEQLHSNLKALDVNWGEETSVVLAALAEQPSDYWQKRSRLVWN